MGGGSRKVWAVVGVMLFDVSVNYAATTYLGKKWSVLNLITAILFLIVALLRQFKVDRFGILVKSLIEAGFSLVTGAFMAYFARNHMPVDLVVGMGCASLSCLQSSPSNQVISLNQSADFDDAGGGGDGSTN